MDEAKRGTLIIAQQMQPDRYFNVEQIRRLQDLTQRAQKLPTGLTSEEEGERLALIEAELLASAQRTSDLADALGR
jgi:hypothetical protein